MKKFEIIALIVLVVIVITCIFIFSFQFFTSNTDVPTIGTPYIENTVTEDNTTNTNEALESNVIDEETSDFFDITQEEPVTNPPSTNYIDITITDITENRNPEEDNEFQNIVDESSSSNVANTTNNNDEISGVTISSITPEISSFPYYIKVNVVANTITVYAKDNNGIYSIPEKAFICSTGTATPHSGVYATPKKFEWVDLFGNCYGQYSTQIVGNILFHSVPYNIKYNKGSLRYNYYNKLGSSVSAGCVRLTVADAKWLYDNCPIGTKVEFYDDISSPGPLGKPEAQKISSNSSYRGWDPTDPDPANPWHN